MLKSIENARKQRKTLENAEFSLKFKERSLFCAYCARKKQKNIFVEIEKYLLKKTFLVEIEKYLLPKPINQRLGVDSQTLKTGFFYLNFH